MEADPADYRGLIGLRTTRAVKAELARLQAEGKTVAIKKLRLTRQGLEFELHDAAQAAELLSRHLGILKDRLEVTLKPPLVDQEAQRRLLEDSAACELACELDARLALPSPGQQNGPGVAQDEPIDVEWSNLPGEGDKPA